MKLDRKAKLRLKNLTSRNRSRAHFIEPLLSHKSFTSRNFLSNQKQKISQSIVCYLFSLVFCFGCVTKKTLTTREQQKFSKAYEIVESLTTDVGARLAGTAAEKRARQWAVRKMKSLGLKNVRIEPFQVQQWQRVHEEAKVVSPAPQNLRITALGGSIGTSKKGLQSTVVVFESMEELKKAPLKGYKNKIIFIDEKMERLHDGGGYSKAVKKRYESAAEEGKRMAAAVLIRSVGTDSHRFPHTGQTKYNEASKKIPIAALSNPDADQLRRLLNKSEVELYLNIQVRNQGKKQSGNVIGEVPGQTDEIVLLGAHLDSWDLGTGAIDDGAGVGIVLATAHQILSRQPRPFRTIRVVLFGAEEVGLIGAKAYAKKYHQDSSKHFLAAEADFGARKAWRLNTNLNKFQYSQLDQLLVKLAPLGITMGKKDTYGGPDLIPLLEKKVNVVQLEQVGIDYFDFHHTEDDTLDKIDPKELDQNVSAWTHMAWWAANIKAR